MQVGFELNGEHLDLDVEASVSLADLLHSRLAAASVHLGCEQGVCGACAVLVDEEAVRSCLMLGVQADGRRVTTAEGVARRRGGRWSEVEAALVGKGAFQCGFCTSGVVVALEELRAGDEPLTREDVVEQLSGQICRCTGYVPILEAFVSLLASTGRMREEGGR